MAGVANEAPQSDPGHNARRRGGRSHGREGDEGQGWGTYPYLFAPCLTQGGGGGGVAGWDHFYYHQVLPIIIIGVSEQAAVCR